MASIYAAVRKYSSPEYEIEIPDFAGCRTIAKTCGDIQKKAREEIDKYINLLIKSGVDFIYISTFKTLVDLPEYFDDVTWHCIPDVDMHSLKVKYEAY